MKEKNSKINKKIYMLILLIILLLTSTYAWFTINKNVRVETLNVQVATTGNLEISVDAINWKTSVNSDELLNGIHKNYPNALNQIPEKGLYPTSSAGNLSNGKMDMFYGQVQVDREIDAYNLIATKEEEQHGTNGKFIAFDIFLRVAEDTTLNLNAASKIYSEGFKDASSSTGIENASRIAILNHGTGSTPGHVQNLKSATTPIIIEPNYDVHTETGIQSARSIYGITGLKYNGNNALPYYGIKREITTARPLTDKTDTYFSLVNPTIKLEKSFFGREDRKELFRLSKGITKLRIYLWVEGQDVDCEDSASGANLKFDLQFTT